MKKVIINKKVVLAVLVMAVAAIFFLNKKPTKTVSLGFGLGDYSNCVIDPRINMNTNGVSNGLTDKSELICDKDNKRQVLVEVLDKPGFEDAKNSIYEVWKDDDGYKVLVVDQNGAGSGEGNGKTLLLKNNDYKLLECFYYLPEKSASKTKVVGEACGNFVLKSNVD